MSVTKIWMPLYIADYLADTTRLTTLHHGAYMLLIMDYWRNGPLPDDDSALSNITRMSVIAWKKIRPSIAQMFQVADGEWRHKRIDAELQEAAINSIKYSERAKKAAEKRWAKQSSKHATGNATSNADAVLDECTSPSPSPSPSVTTDVVTSAGKPAVFSALDELLQRGVSKQVSDDWLKLRKKRRAEVTATALMRLEREAEKAGVSLQAALEICCQNGWQGFEASWISKVVAAARSSPRAEAYQALTGRVPTCMQPKTAVVQTTGHLIDGEVLHAA